MALNSTGPISIGGSTTGQSINLELGRTATQQSSLNETDLRTLAKVASGAISLDNFHGKARGVVATGGTITTSGGYRYHKFTSSGTFTISENPLGTTFDVQLVGGGAGGGTPGGSDFSGGGGAGEVRTNIGLTLAVGSYSVGIGQGGIAGVQYASATSFTGLTSANPGGVSGTTGGTSGNGYTGGGYSWENGWAGGGGGAGGNGYAGSLNTGGNGGPGVTGLDGVVYAYGGGGGGWDNPGASYGTPGSGGTGGINFTTRSYAPTGGQSGVVIVRYAYS